MMLAKSEKLIHCSSEVLLAMRTFGLIVASLTLSVLLHVAAAILGSLVTYFCFGKDPIVPVFFIGWFYLPFFACGMTLAATRGLQYPLIVAPFGALAVVALVVAAVSDQIGLTEVSLLFTSVPFSFLGCLASNYRRRWDAGIGSEPSSEPHEAASTQATGQGEPGVGADSR
jgi:peptidoglycan/LPS O-acetylase OafA/YrhL